MKDNTDIEINIKKQAANDIKAIKKRAKDDISKVKFEMRLALHSNNEQAVERITLKEKKRILAAEQQAEWEKTPKIYSTGEEIFNSITHGIGAGLAVAALVLLIVKAVFYAPPGQTAYYVVSWTIFGSTLIILYMMSTLYHALTPRKAKAVFAIFDHSAIYLLIAGTYTPFCLGSLRGSVGWTLFGIIWGLAIIGIVMYSIFGKKARVFSVITYLIMGWLIVFAFGPMRQVLPQTSLSFLIAGGSAYTLGVIFYSLKKIKWMHPIWHLFVLAGSIFHFFAVYFSI